MREPLVSIIRGSILNIRAAACNRDSKLISYELEHLEKLLKLFVNLSSQPAKNPTKTKASPKITCKQ